MPEIKIKNERGKYGVYVDGELYSTCENMSEVAEEMEEIRDAYRKRDLCTV